MDSTDGPEREANAEERLRMFSAALLRIGASLDLDTVLNEIVVCARELTGARCGALVTVDAKGKPRDFVTSGLTAEEHRAIQNWPERLHLFEHLHSLKAPLRLLDVQAYIDTLGYSPLPISCKSFQGTLMRHGETSVGGFFLAGKKGGFTEADEEMLVLFAMQAASAVRNAHAHDEEQRTRKDLEALIETCPVGVAVLDLKSGVALSLNIEAMRIAARLGLPDHDGQLLLEMITCHRGDGQEIAFGNPADIKPVRGEEIEVSVPDGRSVTVLVNATPIRSEHGELVSAVITVQDLAPLQELERQRTEFLGMVSHELRTPLISIKGSTATALNASPALTHPETHELFRIIDQQAEHMRSLVGDLLDAGRINAGVLSLSPEAEELADLIEQARTVFLNSGRRHAVNIDLPPDLPRVMADGHRIVQVLNNLLFNAAEHTPESSSIQIAAARDGSHVAVSVSDTGKGIPSDSLAHLFRKYAAGRHGTGLGLAICKGLVEAHGGRIRAENKESGQGAQFTFTIPIAKATGPDKEVGFVRRSSPRTPKGSVLIVDDDPHFLGHVRSTIEEAGYAALVTGDPGELPRLLRTKKPKLVLLDLMLPGTDGIELMETVPELADLPVIFVSGYGRDETIARALEVGATDYLVKPFSPIELKARVDAALRRLAEPEHFVLGDLTINYERRLVTIAGRPVEMTATEYELLRLLSVNAGRVMTHDHLFRQIWEGRNADGLMASRAFIRKLRRKLGDDTKRPAYILTERGVGYRMPEPHDPQNPPVPAPG